MKITFNKFRQIFWMVVALLFIALLFLNLWTNLFYFYSYSHKAEGVAMVYRINKITGTTEMKGIGTIFIDKVTPSWIKTTAPDEKNLKEE